MGTKRLFAGGPAPRDDGLRTRGPPLGIATPVVAAMVAP